MKSCPACFAFLHFNSRTAIVLLDLDQVDLWMSDCPVQAWMVLTEALDPGEVNLHNHPI